MAASGATRKKTGPKSASSNPMAKAAMKKILSLCVGNGYRKSEIKITDFKGQTLSLEAFTLIQPHVEANIQEKKGRVKGDKVFSDRASLDKELENLKSNLADNDKLLENIQKQIRQRGDKGVGIQGEKINLKTLDKSYVCHQTCQTCQGKGGTQCPKCAGHKTIQCIRCHGERMVQCVVCSGSTTIAGPDGQQKPCPRCSGHGKVACDYCKGNGQAPCDRCQGAGKIKCGNCDGAGANSSIAQVNIQAHIQGQIKTTHVSEDIAQKINAFGPMLVTGKLAKIKTIDSGKNEDGLPRLRYSLDLPYAEMTLRLGKKDLTTNIIGYNPRFLDLPALLDQKLGPVIQYAGGDSAKLAPAKALQKIGKFRVFREAMAVTAKRSVNAAANHLENKYAPLLSRDNAQNIALNTNRLLDKATDKPRKAATIWVSVIMILLFTAYYLGPLRTTLIDIMEREPVLYSFAPHLGWGILLFGLLLTGPLHKILSKFFFNARLGKVLPAQYSNLLLVKLRKFHIVPLLLTALYFFIFYLGVDVMGFDIPRGR